MSEWICTKCGETASSKCPNQRNIFPSNQMATAISNELGVNVLKSELFSEIILTYTDFTCSSSIEEALERILKTLQYAKAHEILPVIGCAHNWILNSHTRTHCSLDGEHDNLTTYKQKATEYKLSRELRGAFQATISSICGVVERTCPQEDRHFFEVAKGAMYYACGKYMELVDNPEQANSWTVRWKHNKANFDDLKSAEAFLELVQDGKLISNAKGETK